MRSIRIAALVMAGSIGLLGCPASTTTPDGGNVTPPKDGGQTTPPDSGTVTPPGDAGMQMPGDAGAVVDGGYTGEVADFAKELILNHSTDADPLPTEAQRFATDTQDASKFPPAFFQ